MSPPDPGMPGPDLTPDLTWQEVAQRTELSLAARGIFQLLHSRASDGEYTTLDDVLAVTSPSDDASSVEAALVELYVMDVVDTDNWPRTVIRP